MVRGRRVLVVAVAGRRVDVVMGAACAAVVVIVVWRRRITVEVQDVRLTAFQIVRNGVLLQC